MKAIMEQQTANWPLAVLIAIDQLGNAVAGGHPDATISARVGYFSANAKFGRAYWQLLEWMIDLTFFPVHGYRHCYQAWQNDADERFQRGNDFARFLLGLIILVVCPPIALALRLFVLLIPAWRFDHGD